MVVRLSCLNSFLVKRDRRLLLPTPDSPIKTTEEKQISPQEGQIFNQKMWKVKKKMSLMWKTATRWHLWSNLTQTGTTTSCKRGRSTAEMTLEWEEWEISASLFRSGKWEARPQRIVRNTRGFVLSRRPKGKWFTAKWAGRKRKKEKVTSSFLSSFSKSTAGGYKRQKSFRFFISFIITTQINKTYL